MKHRNKKLYFKGFAMLFWLLFLQQSNAYYVPYLIVGTAGILCFYANEKEKKEPPKGKEQMFLFVLSIIFAMVAAASNYGVFRDLACPKEAGKLFQWCYKGISVILVFGGGIL